VAYRCEPYRLEIDGTTTTAPRFLITFANGREATASRSPNADPRATAGRRDVVAGGAPWQQFWRARRLKSAARGGARDRAPAAAVGVSGDR
jgi:hypothetical protein